ncbi:MAG: PA-phosphatase [Gammaproteobacteria bacterium]|nr:PA-phosphatase [Gammaproteobacteria bacterium]|tara:strand:- start:898 stop:1197 length:300 start_codon:yes stop_codon:yes gene_type:complete
MSDKNIESLQDILAMMNPEVHMNLKTAVELGRWPDGRKLSAEQLESCLQAIIAYEEAYLPEQQRVGYIDRTGLKKTDCDDPAATEQDHDQVMPINVTKH